MTVRYGRSGNIQVQKVVVENVKYVAYNELTRVLIIDEDMIIGVTKLEVEEDDS